MGARGREQSSLKLPPGWELRVPKGSWVPQGSHRTKNRLSHHRAEKTSSSAPALALSLIRPHGGSQPDEASCAAPGLIAATLAPGASSLRGHCQSCRVLISQTCSQPPPPRVEPVCLGDKGPPGHPSAQMPPFSSAYNGDEVHGRRRRGAWCPLPWDPGPIFLPRMTEFLLP